jgi:hypothetical protein
MATTEKQYIPFSFDEIYANIVAQLGNDSVYEGSNLSQLITAMSYLISTLNMNTAANINETFLPLARKTENVLENARLQSYEAYKVKSFLYTITFTLPETILEADKIVLNKYDNFTIGDNIYYYMDNSPLNIFGEANAEFSFTVKEGTLLSYNSDISLYQTLGNTLDQQTGKTVAKGFIDIPYENVEEDGIELLLTYTDSNNVLHSDEIWTKSETMLIDKDYIFNKKFVRKDDITFNVPKCYFKIGEVGNNLPSTTIIKITILQSKGSLGGVIENEEGLLPEITFNGTKFNSENVIITYSLLSEGAEKESIESIRSNAQLFNNTANRVITPIDYVSYCNTQPNIRASKIWGGDEEYPIRPGEIWFSLLPRTFTRSFDTSTDGRTFTLENIENNVNWFLEDAQISNQANLQNPGLWDKLEFYKIPTLKYNNRNPIFINCDFGIKILKFNSLKSESEVNSDVFNVIDTYFKESGVYSLTGDDVLFLEQFNSEFFMTNLIKRINEQVTDSSGFTIDMLNSFTIYDHNLSKESNDPLFPNLETNLSNIDISLSLALPLEGFIDGMTGYLKTERLPNIDATNITFENSLISFEGDLSVDFSDLIDIDQSETPYMSAPIKFVSDGETYIIGKYEIFNNIKKMIKINLWAQDDTSAQQLFDPTGVYADSILVRTMFATPKIMNISFYSPNFKVLKNTVPRLNKVEFYA